MVSNEDRAAKEATRNEIKAICGREPDAVRVLLWMNGAMREESEIVSMLTTVNMDRDDLSDEDANKVDLAIGFLGWMVGEEWLTSKLDGVETYYTPCAKFHRRNTY